MAHEGLKAAEIRLRAAEAREGLRACELCERRCGVDRLAGERAPCGLGAETYCFKRHVSFAEELELLPSYMVYFGGCNFRCRFCVQAPECFKTSAGVLVDAGRAVADFSDKVARGARTINLLGGEPTLHLHTILEIAAEAAERGERLPLVVNSNMYMTPRVIELLDGVASMYIADIKFGNDGCARELAGVERYVEVVTRNIADAAARTRVLVRHLLMPGHLECCLRPAAEWMARHLPEASFSLMTGYVPAYRAGEDATLNRLLTEEEREVARGIVRGLGLQETA